jgi:DNA-binding transcriptional ArsR family regulator
VVTAALLRAGGAEERGRAAARQSGEQCRRSRERRGVHGERRDRRLAARPGQTLELIAEELTSAHARLIAPHWDRMRGIIEADVTYQGAVLARGGAAVLFAGLHAGVRWEPGRVTVTRYGPGPHEYQVTPGPVGGLVLVPSVLIWPDTTVKAYSSSQTTLRYPARGAAAAWPRSLPLDAPGQALRDLLGAPRARLLEELRGPASTATLARWLRVSPAAVSQHLTVLRRCGLVNRTRCGREVLYQASDLGLSLLDGPAAVSAR